MLALVLLIALMLAPAPASALTQTFYLHYSASGVSVPGSPTPQNHYMDQTQPSGSSPAVRGPYSINQGATTTIPAFTSTAIAGGINLERLSSVTVNMSANHTLNGCITVAATVSRLDASGNATALASGAKENQSLSQGSGGGLQGNTAVTVPLLMDPDRTIVAGGAIKLSLAVTNSCGSNVSVRIAVDGTVNTGVFSRTTFETPDVTLYGPPDSFGEYGTSVTSNGVTATIARSPVSTWSTDAGLSLGFGTTASDGSVFIGDYFYNGYAFTPSSCSMAITCFNPWSKECPAGAGKDNFGNIRIKYGTPPNQYEFNPSTVTDPSECFDAPYWGGSDVADVQVINDGGEKLMWLSSRASSVTTEPYPAAGRLEKLSGTWTLTSPRTRADLSTDPAGAQVCPDFFGSPSCGLLSEFQQLPTSKHIVIAQYGTGIAVMNQAGQLVAQLVLPSNAPANDSCGVGVTRAAKTVSVDPSSTSLSNERFVISYDAIEPSGAFRSNAFQVFKYDSTVNPPVVSPVTPPMFATSVSYPSAPCGTGFYRVSNSAVFDDHGNLMVKRDVNATGVGIADVFVPGSTQLTACTIPNVTDVYGASCVADQEFTGIPTKVMRVVQDPTTGAVFYVGLRGKIGTLARNLAQPLGQQFTQKTTVVDLLVGKLDDADPLSGLNHGVSRPFIDAARRTLWLPLGAGSGSPPESATPIPGKSWLYAVDIDRLLTRP